MSSSSGSSAAVLESWSCGFAVAVEAILPDRRLWSMAVSNQASMGEESCCRPPARRLSCRRDRGFWKDRYRFCYDLGHFLRRHFLRTLVAFLRILCAFFAHFMHFRSSRPNAVDAQAC